jgi:SAM-dependent methyltransferase
VTGTRRDLDGAYALAGPADSVAYYRDWAARYDGAFAAGHDYVYPAEIARVFREAGGAGPVLDIGAGTGLVAAALPGIEIDAIDISAEMLAEAGRKGLYRQRIVADLNGPLDLPDAAYAGLASAGTFTQGHVGPGCLPELLRIARAGAIFVLGIHEAVLDSGGFGSALARLAASGRIGPLGFREVPIYGPGAAHEHAGDRALVAIFARRGRA